MTKKQIVYKAIRLLTNKKETYSCIALSEAAPGPYEDTEIALICKGYGEFYGKDLTEGWWPTSPLYLNIRITALLLWLEVTGET